MAGRNEDSKFYLGYTFQHFLRFHEQLASRLEDHRTFGNFICHLIGGPLNGTAACGVVYALFGSDTVWFFVAMLSLWAVYNDLLFGGVYAAFLVTATYYQLTHLTFLTLYPSIYLFLASVTFQLLIGHGLMEGRPPNELEGVVKGTGVVFTMVDILMEVAPATFHFYSILFLRLGFRPELNAVVQTELGRIKGIKERKRVHERDENSKGKLHS